MRSILSTGEREVARRLADGDSLEEIAEARDDSVETVEKHVDRIREKTERAFATLAESPFTEEFADELDGATRRRIHEATAGVE